MVETRHLVVYVIRGALVASQQVRCPDGDVAAWGQPGAVARSRGGRRVAWTRPKMGEAGRGDQRQEICKESQ